MSNSKKIYTGIGLDPEVAHFLAELGRETERPRSWLINALIRDQAERLRLEQEAKAAEENLKEPPVIQI